MDAFKRLKAASVSWLLLSRQRYFIYLGSLAIMAFILITRFVEGAGHDSDKIIGTSIINLLATPELFNGKRISTDGIITIGFEENALHISTEAAANASKHYSIRLGLDEKYRNKTDLDGKWVYVVGTFYKKENSVYPGYISDITEIFDSNDVVIEELQQLGVE